MKIYKFKSLAKTNVKDLLLLFTIKTIKRVENFKYSDLNGTNYGYYIQCMYISEKIVKK